MNFWSYLCVYACILCMCFMYVCVCLCVSHMCMCVCVWICMYLCVCVCAFGETMYIVSVCVFVSACQSVSVFVSASNLCCRVVTYNQLFGPKQQCETEGQGKKGPTVNQSQAARSEESKMAASGSSANDDEFTKPIFKNGRYENPWENWRKPGLSGVLKMALTTKNTSNIPSQEVTENDLFLFLFCVYPSTSCFKESVAAC